MRLKHNVFTTQTALVTAILLVCGVTLVIAAGMLWHEANHPLAYKPYLEIYLMDVLPYLGATLMACLLRRYPVLLSVLLLLTTCAAGFGTYERYLQMEEALRFLDARAAGRRLLRCGVTWVDFAVAVEYCLIGFGVAPGVMWLLIRRPLPSTDHWHSAARDG